jgi:hypothetical protein
MTAADFSAAPCRLACPALRGKPNEIKKTKLDNNPSPADGWHKRFVVARFI